jgi:hypothetical protein
VLAHPQELNEQPLPAAQATVTPIDKSAKRPPAQQLV